jgi:16S rRNA processing protein RimM
VKVTVARIGRAHGLQGEVSLELRTDIPERRLAPGAALETEPASAGPLTVERARTQAGRWYVQFRELADRTAAENARGVELLAEADDEAEDDAWYVHELVGLRAVKPDGTEVGEVTDLVSMPAHDLLEVRQASGHRALIPFVDEFVPEVDPEAGTVTVTPPHGLLDGETPDVSEETH